jgi:endonuclease/exonuclease/phosphatase family metal-dependent hydrolase
MLHCRHTPTHWLAFAGLCLLTGSAVAQLRVVSWNVSNYTGGRTSAIQTAVYGSYLGRSLAPDIILMQECQSTSGMNAFLTILNGAPGSPGDWAASSYFATADAAMFYRTTRVTQLGPPLVASEAGSFPDPPRATIRYRVRPVGYDSDGGILILYNSHMKAPESGTADETRRLTEAENIRENAGFITDEWHFVLAGDLNIQSSSEAAYQELVGDKPFNNDGRFFDPINRSGNWNNNGFFRFIHTQDPAGPGGMDDRYDQILVSDNLIDGGGFEYAGDANEPYSTLTWDDANHSYRCWGNDGSSFNSSLTVSGNTMVGPTIASALITACAGAGHLPVYLDLRVPAEIDADLAIDFGQVAQGGTAEELLSVSNAGDVAMWTAAGISDLNYSFLVASGFSAPAGDFSAAAGAGANQHVIAMDTSTAGPKNGLLIIQSDAPDEPNRTVTLTGEVVGAADGACCKFRPAYTCTITSEQDCLDDLGSFQGVGTTCATPCLCFGDMDCDGDVDFDDISLFVAAIGDDGTAWAAAYEALHGAPPPCDFLNGDSDADGDVDFDDISPFVNVIGALCS